MLCQGASGPSLGSSSLGTAGLRGMHRGEDVLVLPAVHAQPPHLPFPVSWPFLPLHHWHSA